MAATLWQDTDPRPVLPRPTCPCGPSKEARVGADTSAILCRASGEPGGEGPGAEAELGMQGKWAQGQGWWAGGQEPTPGGGLFGGAGSILPSWEDVTYFKSGKLGK